MSKFNFTNILHFILFIVLIISIVPIFSDFPILGIDSSWENGMNTLIGKGEKLGENVFFTYGPFIGIYQNYYHPDTYLLNLFVSIPIAISFFLMFYQLLKNENILYELILIILLLILYFLATNKDYLFYFYPILLFSFIKKINIGKIENKYFYFLIVFFPIGSIFLIKCSYSIFYFFIIFIILFYNKKVKEDLSIIFILILSVIFYWIISWQELSYLYTFFRYNIFFTSGFTEAMSDGNSFELELIFLILSSLIVFPLLMKYNYHSCTLLLVCLIACFFVFKASFIRADKLHMELAFLFLVLLSFSVFVELKTKIYQLIFLMSMLMIFSVYNYRVKNIVSSIKLNFNNDYKELVAKKTKKEMYYLALSEINKHHRLPSVEGTVDIYNYDQNILLSSDNNWVQRPIFQSYTAYTPELLIRNKENLLSEKNPQFIFFKVQTIDNRLPSLEDGNSWSVILNNYSPIEMINDDYLILKRNKNYNSDVSLKSIKIEKNIINTKITLPFNENKNVLCKIYLNKTLYGGLKNKFYKMGSDLKIRVQLNNGIEKEFRLVSGMIETEFLISPLITDTKEFYNLYKGNEYGNTVKHITILGDTNLWRDDLEIEFLTY